MTAMIFLGLGLAFLALCLVAALSDIRSMIIPNKINAAILVTAIPAALVSGIGLAEFGWHILIAVIALVVGFALFAFRVIGGGDAKMLPGVFLWLGPTAAMPFLFAMSIVGGIMTLVIVVWRVAGKYYPIVKIPGLKFKFLESGGGVPYGVAIAMGVVLAGAHSPLLAPPLLEIMSPIAVSVNT